MSRLAILAALWLVGCRAAGTLETRRTDERGATTTAARGEPSQTVSPPVVPAAWESSSAIHKVELMANSVLSGGSLLPAAQSTSGVAVSDEQPNAESSALTLASLEQIAGGQNPTISQAGALVRQQEGLTLQAGLYPNPSLGYVRSDADQTGQSQSQGVFVGQEFVTAGKLRLAEQAGWQDVVLRQWQLSAQQTRVLNDLRIRFYEVLGAQRALLVAGELQRSAEDGVQIARELLEARKGSRPDLLQAEMQLSLAQGAVADAKFRRQAARRQLAIVAGLPELPAGDLVGTLNDDLPELNWDTCWQRLLDESPLLKSQAAELQAAQTEVQLARAQAVPNVSLQVVAQHDNIQKFNSLSTFVALPVPLFNRNQGNIINSEAFLLQQQKEYERLRLALADQLTASFRQYSSLRSEAARIRRDVLPRAVENLELTTQAYRLGRMDFLRVVDARRTYFQAKQSEIDSSVELHKVMIEIEGLQLTGGLNPTEVGTALQSTPGAGGLGQRGVLSQQLQQQRGSSSRNLPGAIQAGEQ